MKTFNILENGEVINTILADLSFVQEHFSEYEEVDTSLEDPREWRDSQLAATDWIVPITDHPQHADYLVYRQALRDWPSTEDFPETRPSQK
jgi:hypothetical protein